MFLATHGVLRRSTSTLFDSTSFLFDGISDYMETNANYTMLDNQPNFSISLWVKLNATGTQRLVFLVGTTRLFVYVRSNGAVDASVRTSSYYVRSGSNAITLGNWHHIVWTYDGSQTRYNRYGLYVDGVSNISTNQGSVDSTMLTFTAPLNIGKVSTTYLNANVNEVSFWNTTLNSTNVTEIYNNGQANDLNNLTTASQPNNWWRSENATFDGTNWSVPDTNGLFPITTSGMGASSIENDVPI